jgi:hypothetical protein
MPLISRNSASIKTQMEEKMVEKNEFDTLDADDIPEAVETSAQADEMISKGSAPTVYDYNTAPDYVKAPARVDLNGKEVTVEKAEIIIPPLDKPWGKTRDGSKDVKNCTFKLTYSIGGQVEYYSGVRVFKSQDGKYSHPSMTRDRKNLASMLLGTYADFKKKDINEVSLKEFLSFLNSKPKAKLKTFETKNPETGEMVKKNVVEKFLN